MTVLSEIDSWFMHHDEPTRGYLLALRALVLKHDRNLSEAWKYKMPFYCYDGKMCCYLWVHKKSHQPYIGFVEGEKIRHPLLLQEKRARMKILLLDPEKDIPLKAVRGLLDQMVKLYR
jgi:hypothetical protein